MNKDIDTYSQDALCNFSDEKRKLLKDTVCKGASDIELQLFLHVCIKTGLDPFMKQIYSIPRGNQRTIQTSIDGLRLIAERTGRYAPGKEPVFKYDSQGILFSSTATIKKMTADGSWHEVSATALFSEYNPGNNPFWKKMPHLMLAKCAEAAALRKSFPAEMSGVYAEEEMMQANKDEEPKIEIPLEPLEEKEKVFKEHASFFPEEDEKLIVEYLLKYGNHWKKTASEVIEDYKDNEKFLADFAKYKKRFE